MVRQLTFATLLLAGSNILSKILGLLRDFVLAQAGGTGWQVDAYNLAFTLPDLINHFLGAGLMSITLIPILTPHLNTSSDEEVTESGLIAASTTIKNILTPIFLLVVLISVICFVWMESIIPLMSSQPLPADVIDEAVRYTRILIFAQVSFVCGGFFLAFQYSRYSYVFPALAPLVYNAGIIIGGLVSVYWGDGSLDGFCWGVLIASILGNFLLQFYGAWRVGFRVLAGRMSWWSPELKRYLWLTLPFLFAVGASFSSEFVYKYFGGVETGDIATLGFGLRINMALVGVFGGAVGVAGYPFMARLVHQAKWGELNQLLADTIEKILVLLIPVCIITAALAEPLVKMYLGGGAFSDDSVLKVAEALRLYLWSAIPMSALLIMSRSFYASSDTWTPSILTCLAFVLALPLYSVLGEMGAMRVPVVSSITVGIQFLALFVMWLTRHPDAVFKRIPISTLKMLPSSFALYLGVSAWSIKFQLMDDSRWELLFWVPLIGLVSLVAFFISLFPLQIQGYWQLVHRIWSKISPNKSSHTL